MTTFSEPVLSLTGVSKSFGFGKVLNSVDFQAKPGSLLGLVGENGAGKSTLLKIVAGLESPDEGTIVFRNEEVTIPSYRAANDLGISMVFQEQALIPQLRVYENLFLGLTDRFSSGAVLRRKEMQRRAQEIFDDLGIEKAIRPNRYLSEYSFGQRQLIEIARAFAVADLVGAEFPVILLDEATASLDGTERQILFRLINRLRDRAAIVFVSHILSEILELSDELLILKDGQVVAHGETQDYDEYKLHALITGRDVPESLYQEDAQCGSSGEIIFETHDLGLDGEFEGVSFSVGKGEVIGVAGVIGSGKELLGKTLAGLEPNTSGTIVTQSKSAPGYVPKERLAEGIIADASVGMNASITPIARGAFRNGIVLDKRSEKRWATEAVHKLDIRPADIAAQIGRLSGGNQQKAVMARWLVETPEVLVLDNPTRGVDVGSKFAIYTLIRELTSQGVGVVLISDDLSELIGLSDRILALRDHQVVSELAAPPEHKPSEAELVSQIV